MSSFPVPASSNAAVAGSEKSDHLEGIVVGPNVRQSPFANIVEPGMLGSYMFGSGIALSSPVPTSFALDDRLHGSTLVTLQFPDGEKLVGLMDR